MLLCTRSQIVDLLHEKYVEACEGQNAGIVDRTISAVSSEISDMLAYHYPQPWEYVPQVITYIASVISAYRVVEAITSLVSSEGSTDNEWIPLQKQWKYVTDLLASIAAGKTKLDLKDKNPDREDPVFAVVTIPKTFHFEGF